MRAPPWHRIAIATVITALPLVAAPQSIREIDFKNASYAWDDLDRGVPSNWHWLAQLPHGSVRLKNGQHRVSDGSESGNTFPDLSLVSVTYGDLFGDGREEAAVHLLYRTGGTANWSYLYVYTLDSQQPKLIAVLESGSRADGGLLRVKIQKHLLILDFLDSELREGDCCSEGFVRVRYHWQRDKFIEPGVRQKGKLPLIVHRP